MVKTGAGFCDVHRKAEQKRIDQRRGSSTDRGYDSKWRKAREHFLKEHPLCVQCEVAGRVVASSVVDHIIPHKGDMKLFWNRNNWQALCKPCHDSKTAREDGRWG